MKQRTKRFYAIATLVGGLSAGSYGFLTAARQSSATAAVDNRPAAVSTRHVAPGSYAMYYPRPRSGSARTSSLRPRGPQGPGKVPEIPVSTGYIDGVYTGRRESAYYGIVQVQAVIQGGNLVDVRILSYPNDNGTSRYINSIAIPRLIRESISAQGSHVRLVSGATFTSEAYHLSLHLALVQAVG